MRVWGLGFRISGLGFSIKCQGLRVEGVPVIEPTGGKTVMMFVVYRYRKSTVLTCHNKSELYLLAIKALHPGTTKFTTQLGLTTKYKAPVELFSLPENFRFDPCRR